MLSYCVKNYKSCTYKNDTKKIRFFIYPKEATICQQRLNACQRSETNLKVDLLIVCSNHFDYNYFILEFTKPRSKNMAKQIKQLKQLKTGSVPNLMLSLNSERKRKEIEKDTEKLKKLN
ncbi:hypothetical protein ALC56_09907 [Trachymyrmex septentrionalis]|uniref:THAP-type domain-containing protein n=1 Tax=Trachymyrmex septentrionalis TaxID=34720 RepID=A0A151JUQ5_9HYME|nr:hypothetical protein ALC56_09907 [Trachymyrmex septentrionalis]